MKSANAKQMEIMRADRKKRGLVRWIWDDWVTPKEAKRLDKLRAEYERDNN